MEPIVQEDDYGCGVACVAFVLTIPYKKAVLLFKEGEIRVKGIPDFYCREICEILGEYSYKYIKPRLRNRIYAGGTIVFIKKSGKYKYGHYLVRFENKWMDPWINFPDEQRIAGFRNRLPGKPIYMIYKKEKSPVKGIFRSCFLDSN